MATLHLMVGLPCSGKTTYAKKLAETENVLLLTPDVWQLKLFGQDFGEPEHDNRHTLIEEVMISVAYDVLKSGTSVILDFGFWAKSERDFFREKAKELNVGFKIHFMDTPLEELYRRVEIRNQIANDEIIHFDPKYLELWSSWFQPPDAEELSQ
jgi:Predicted kinase